MYAFWIIECICIWNFSFKDELVESVNEHEKKLREVRLDYEKQLNALRSEIIKLKDEVMLKILKYATFSTDIEKKRQLRVDS